MTVNKEMTWNRDQAIWLCTQIEKIAPAFGAHVALTGGCLYNIPLRDGESVTRKDVDIVLYRIRSRETIDIRGLFVALLEKLDINRKPYSQRKDWFTSFVVKAVFRGRDVDFFFPENDGKWPSGEDYNKDGLDDALCIFCRKHKAIGPFEKYCSSNCKRRDESGEEPADA